MLPDFPAEKQRVSELWTAYLRRRVDSYLGFLAALPRHYIHHEGHAWSTTAADGSVGTAEYTTIQSLVTMSTEDLVRLSDMEVAAKLDGVARDLARQQSQAAFESLSGQLRDARRLAPAPSASLTKEAFLAGLEQLDIDFDRATRKPKLPILVTDPKTAESLGGLEAWEADPEFKARLDQLTERKREDWRDRESRRKLVD